MTPTDDAHTTDPETTMPDDKTPPEPPAPRPSQPPALDPWLARMDRVVDLVAIAALTLLWLVVAWGMAPQAARSAASVPAH